MPLEREGKYNKKSLKLIEHYESNFVGYIFTRTVTRTHIPKRHHDFENPVTGPMFDNTNNRIYGESNQQIMNTNNTEYGTGKSKADGIARIGRKNAQFEREIERQVM